MMVGVDEPGGDERPAQVDRLVGGRLLAGAGLRDEAVLDEQPAAVVLGACLVAHDDVGIRVEGSHASRETSSNRSTSTRPRSVILRLGITERARNAIVWKGEWSSQPRLRAASTQARLRWSTSSRRAVESRPATCRGNSARTPRPSVTTTPPPVSDRRTTARAMSWSFMPTT